jgi:hypothetical protein
MLLTALMGEKSVVFINVLITAVTAPKAIISVPNWEGRELGDLTGSLMCPTKSLTGGGEGVGEGEGGRFIK